MGMLAVGALLCGCGNRGEAPAGGTKQPVVGVSLMNLFNEFIVMLNRALEAKARASGVRIIVNDAERREAGGELRRPKGDRLIMVGAVWMDRSQCKQ